MGILETITSVGLDIVSTNPAARDISREFGSIPYMSLAKKPMTLPDKGNYGIVDGPAPRNIDFFQQNSMYFLDLYYRASYYFYHCSILNTVIRKIIDESLRNGLELVPRFQSKCPSCGQEYESTTKKCKACRFKGEMIPPDLTQKKLLINWRGNSIMDEVNKNGWTMQDLCASFLTTTLVYNQPIILCKSKYGVDEEGNAIEEFPQEFVPISPTKARMLFDETGEPGQGTGFKLRDRSRVYSMIDSENPFNSGYHEGQRLYPARWSVSINDGGWEAGSTYYAEPEIFHKVYSIPSMTYGTPICTLVEYAIRAWIALEMRVEKYYNTGHPQGIFAISGITPDQMAAVQQSIREQMRDDPYTMPMMGIPPGGGDTNKTAKWFQLADNPTADMMAVKAELQQRVSGAFGVSGLFLGDVHSIKGNSNETQQMAVMDRNLTSIRAFVNAFLLWVVRKYKGCTDWIIRIKEPVDEQTRKQQEDLNKSLVNAKLAQDIGFPIISLTDNKVEIGDTPINFDMLGGDSSPISKLLGGKSKGGKKKKKSSGGSKNNGGTKGINLGSPGKDINVNDLESHLFGTDVGDSADVGNNMMRDVSPRENIAGEEMRQKGLSVTPEQLGRIIAEMMKQGVVIQ